MSTTCSATSPSRTATDRSRAGSRSVPNRPAPPRPAPASARSQSAPAGQSGATPQSHHATSSRTAPQSPAGARDSVNLSPETRESQEPQDYPSTRIDASAVVREGDKVKRNQQVTESYHQISQDFNTFLNPDGKADSGANWFDYAKWASREVGDGIQGKDLPPGTNLTGAQDALSEGNTKVYQDIAPDGQDFLKTFGQDGKADWDKFDEWSKRFGDDEAGHLKRDAFHAYYEARFEDDPKKRQELTLQGNLRIAEHEQKLLDPVIDKAFDPVDNSGGFFGDVLKGAANIVLPGSGYVADKVGEELARRIGNPDIKIPDGHGGFANPSLKDDVPGNYPKGLENPENPALRETLERWGGLSTEGSGADDWSSLDQRMRYISNLMRVSQFQGDLRSTDPLAGEAGGSLPQTAQAGPVGVRDLTRSLADNFSFLDTAADGGKGDGVIGRGDLEAAANDSSAPASARDTARTLLRNQPLLSALDVGSGGDVDGKLSLRDLDVFLAGNDLTDAILDTGSGRGSRDHHASDEDLRAVLNSPHLSPEIKARAAAALN